MKLEHVAIDVPDAEAFKAWWCKNLGMRVSSNPGFIMDDSGTIGRAKRPPRPTTRP